MFVPSLIIFSYILCMSHAFFLKCAAIRKLLIFAYLTFSVNSLSLGPSLKFDRIIGGECHKKHHL